MQQLFLVEIEAHEQRYTKEWRDHLPVQLEAAIANRGQKCVVKVISGSQDVRQPGPGAFLNFANTNKFKSEQSIAIARYFGSGLVNPNDMFLFTDAWNPTVIAVRYMSDLLNIPVQIAGLWHSGSYDEQDFLGRSISDKRWSLAFERALFHAIDVNFFATDFHVQLFRRSVCAAKDKQPIKVGWPMEYLQTILAPYRRKKKRDLVVFPHRLAPEKQHAIFDDLRLQLPRVEFQATQEVPLTKAEYHQLLGDAKIVLSASLQETLGISMYEGLLCGAMPLAPSRLSYKEIYSSDWLYPSEWTESFEAYERYKPNLVNRIECALRKFDQHPCAIRQGLKVEAGRIGAQFFDGSKIYEEVLSC